KVSLQEAKIPNKSRQASSLGRRMPSIRRNCFNSADHAYKAYQSSSAWEESHS
ncbi:unnamed protein product, partial [Ceratitis capitata]